VWKGLDLVEKTVNCLAAALLRMELEIGIQDEVRVFVMQPVKPIIGQVEIEDVLAGNAALDQLSDALAQQGGLAAPPDAGDHRDLARQAANGDTPGQQSARRFQVLVFADDSFQAFDHDMARCSLFVLATGVIHAWRAGKSKWFVKTASDSIRFRFWVPNRRPKCLPGTIPLCGKRARMLHRGSVVYAASRSYQATMPPSRSCLLIGPADVRRKSGEMMLLPMPWWGRWVW